MTEILALIVTGVLLSWPELRIEYTVQCRPRTPLSSVRVRSCQCGTQAITTQLACAFNSWQLS